MENAERIGSTKVVQQFEHDCSQSQAVIACQIGKLIEIAQHAGPVANYYTLHRKRFLPEMGEDQPNWNKLRPQAEAEIMGSHNNTQYLHYACLTLNGQSLPHYGECTLLLNDEMIAHRASCFQQNSAVFVHRNGVPFPKGWVSSWLRRARLCVAKLCEPDPSPISQTTERQEFPTLLLKSGPKPVDDEYVEVIILGDLTIRSMEKVSLAKAGTRKKFGAKRKRIRRATKDEQVVKDFCKQNDVECEVI